jgi:transmembrane sensor
MTNASDIEAQAALWLMRNEQSDSQAGGAEFNAWIAADPRHQAAYIRLASVWQRTARLRLLCPEGGRVDADLLAKATPQRFGPWWRFSVAIAASLVIACWWLIRTDAAQTYHTEVGGLAKVVLRDASVVTLNTDTELRVRFTDSRRRVELIRGEAQFTVAHDTGRPFDVIAAGHVVRAVGTQFDVRLDRGESIEVIVVEGKVTLAEGSSVSVIDGKETISAGEAATTQGKKVNVHPVSTAESARRLAWRTGEVSFQGESLTEAVAEFNRYTHQQLRIDDPSLANLRIGGNFQALDIDSFVAALNRSFGITSRTASDGAIALSRLPPERQN